MVLGNFQVGHQYQNQGSIDSTGITRTAPNPADYSNWYVLTKGFAQIDRNQKLGITYESQNVTQNVSNLSDLGVGGGWISFGPTTYNNVVTSTTQDKTTRNRVSGEYDFKDSGALFVQKANVMVYYQDADAIQNAYQQQVGNSALSSWRSRNNIYSQDTYGINTTLESNLTSVVNQRLTYGFDWSSSQISSQLNAAGNGSSITPAPKSTYNLAGAFLQSEMEFNQISVIPALRYDSYSITPVTGSLPSNSGSAVSPRIGAIWNIAREFRPFANWGTGFTAPTPDQTLSYFAGSGYTNIPNPKLKPQTGNGFEVGTRGQLQQFRYQVSGYANSYKDFISQVSSGDRPNQIFQYQNLSEVNIWGWDVRTDWAFAQGWQANAAMAYSDGEQTQHGISAPLNTIQPLRAIAGLRYDASSWGAFANVIWNQGKSADRVNFNNATGGTANQFLSPASTVLNLTGYWKPLKKLTINANLNNVFNTTYWNWSDVQGSVLTQNRAAAGGFSGYNAQAAQQSATAAPRNWQISARYDF
jgi:hemoglobin/transferrin/lactoferrin receptor protein